MVTIKGIFHLNVVSGHEKYLGLPSVVRINKRIFFYDIKLKVIRKILNWQHTHFSSGSKKVIIKAITQVILAYVMSVFKIHVGLYDDIQKVIARF